MLGGHFTPGVIYSDDGHWLRVKTRGPISTQVVGDPIVRMTAEDRTGVVRRVWVSARRRYVTATEFPSGPSQGGVPEPWNRPVPPPKARSLPKPPESAEQQFAPGLLTRYPRPGTVAREPSHERIGRSRPRPELVPGNRSGVQVPQPRRGKTRSRSPQLKIAAPPSPFMKEACYWLPRDLNDLRPAQYAIVEELSGLPWADAAEVRWSSDGALVEHDIPAGLDATELTARVHRVSRPSLRQLEGVRQMLVTLVSRGLVEVVPHDRRRYRLRGWQCLHTRRRITRRAIEHGGGRAVYAIVRFSA